MKRNERTELVNLYWDRFKYYTLDELKAAFFDTLSDEAESIMEAALVESFRNDLVNRPEELASYE